MSFDVAPRSASKNICNRAGVVNGHLFESFRQQASKGKDFVTGVGGTHGQRVSNHLERLFGAFWFVLRLDIPSVGQVNVKLEPMLLCVQGGMVPKSVP